MNKFSRARALVIGVNEYLHAPRLRYAIQDVRQVAHVLSSLHGYEVRLILDHDATIETLREALDALREETDEATRLVVYFAGHGIAEESEGEDGPQGYLLLQDARPGLPSTLLSMAELYQRLSLLLCRHLLIVLDCCFAGAFRWVGTRSILKRRPLYRERYERYLQDPAWQVLTSSAHDERALDGPHRNSGAPDAEAGHSPFAAAFIEGLRGHADLNGDGVVLASELHLFIEDQLAALEHRTQRPAQRSYFFSLRRRDKGEYLFLHPLRPILLPSVLELSRKNNPYRGLLPYDEEHQDIFFGREAVIPLLCAALTAAPLTALVGPSGSGKSSVVRAGVLTRLRKGKQFTLVGPVRPGDNPLQALSAAIERAGWALGTNEASEDLLLRALLGLAAQDSRPVLLVVDQLEESVTLCPETTSTRWLTLLATLLEDSDQRIRLLITLRSDFEPHFMHGTLGRWWAEGRQILPALTQRELRLIIEEPADARLLYFEPPGLVDRLINEVIQMPGALSLLSFALSALYDSRLQRAGDDRSLTEEDYQRIGGVVGALRQRMEEIYERLDALSRATLRRVMLRMVSLEGGEVTRRRVLRSELMAGNAIEYERIAAVLSSLTAARLLVEGEETGEPYVEPAHDALVRGWERLWRWIQEEEDLPGGLRQWRRLTLAARDWHRRQGALWDEDPRLLTALSRLAREPEFFSAAETAFLDASASRRDERQRHDLGGKTQPITSVAPRSQGDIAHEEEIYWIDFSPDGTRLATASRDQTVRVWRLDGTGEVVVLKGHDNAVHLVQFSPDGTRLLSASADKTAILWHADGIGEPRVLPGQDRAVRTAEFSPDGTHVVLLYDDGRVAIWSADNHGQPITLHVKEALRAYFSADGKLLLVESEAEAIKTTSWSLQGGAARQVHESTSQDRLAIRHPCWHRQSRDGTRRMAVVSKTELRIVRTDGTGAPVCIAHTSDGPFSRDSSQEVRWAEFSPDGTRILTLCKEEVRVWRTDEMADPICFWPSAARARFSPDGAFIAAVVGKKIRFWQADGSDQPLIVRGAGIRTFRLSPDGKRLVSTTDRAKKTASIFSSNGTGKPTLLRGHDASVTDAVFTPDGERIVVLAERPYVWNADGSGRPVVLDCPLDPGIRHKPLIRFSPDGSLLVVSVDQYNLVSQDSRSKGRFATTHRVFSLRKQSSEPLLTIEDSEAWIAFGPRGVSLIESPQYGRTYQDEQIEAYYEACQRRESDLGRLGVGVRRWSLDGSELKRIPGSREWVDKGAMANPDGSLLILEYKTWGKDRNLGRDDFLCGTGIWRVPLQGEPELLLDANGNPRDYPNAMFSGDGTYVVSYENKRVLVWRTDSLESEPTSLIAPEEYNFRSVAVSPDNAHAVMRLDMKSGERYRHVAVWSLDAPSTPPRILVSPFDVDEVLFSPNGTWVMAKNNSCVILFPLNGARTPTVLEKHPPLQAQFSPDGVWLLTEGRFDHMELHAVDGSRPPISIGGSAGQFTPDGTRIISVGGNDLLIWLLASPGAPLRTTRPPVPDLAFTTTVSGPLPHVLSDNSSAPLHLAQEMSQPEFLLVSLATARTACDSAGDPADWDLTLQILKKLRQTLGEFAPSILNAAILAQIVTSFQKALDGLRQRTSGTAARVATALHQDLDSIRLQADEKNAPAQVVASVERELGTLISIITTPALQTMTNAPLAMPGSLAPAPPTPVPAGSTDSTPQNSAGPPPPHATVSPPSLQINDQRCSPPSARRSFQAHGPLDPARHFSVPRTALVEQCAHFLLGTPEFGGQFFILWGPRQSGKSWLLRATADQLRARLKDQFLVVVLSMKDLLLDEDDPDEAYLRGLSALLHNTAEGRIAIPESWSECRKLFLKASSPFAQPLILAIDETDRLPGRVLARMLTLFESLAADRRGSILHGLVLAGTGVLVAAAHARGASSYPLLRVPNLVEEEVLHVFQQYQAESGRRVEQPIASKVWELTAGQPGLVSWLAELLTAPDRQTITPHHLTEALLATWSEWNGPLQELVSRGRALDRRQLMALFDEIPAPFSLDQPWCRIAYLDGVIEPRASSDKLGPDRSVCGFSSPLLHLRLFNALLADLDDPEKGAFCEPDDSLKDLFAGECLDCAPLLRRYQSHLTKRALSSPCSSSFLLSEHLFHLLLWLRSAVAGLGRVSPVVFAGEHSTDLLVRLPERHGLVSVSRYVNAAQLASARSRAAYCARRLSLPTTTLAVFVRHGEDASLVKLSGVLVSEGVQLTTVAIACPKHEEPSQEVRAKLVEFARQVGIRSKDSEQS